MGSTVWVQWAQPHRICVYMSGCKIVREVHWELSRIPFHSLIIFPLTVKLVRKCVLYKYSLICESVEPHIASQRGTVTGAHAVWRRCEGLRNDMRNGDNQKFTNTIIIMRKIMVKYMKMYNTFKHISK
jgi:hypothetical protein